MDIENNFLYVLIKHEHKNDNIRKIGCTNNISRRKFEYKTGNLHPVIFEGYFKIPKNFNIFSVEKTVHRDLHESSVFYKDGGKEFFRFTTNPLETVKNILLKHCVKAILVKGDDVIAKPSKTKSEEQDYYDFQTKKIFDENEEYPVIFKSDLHKKLRYYQEEALCAMKNNSIGKLILPTGSGKTVIFLEYLLTKTGLSLIIVPTIILVEQTYNKAKEKGLKNVFKIYSKQKDIIDFSNKKPILIITTYQSSGKYYNKLFEYNYECIVFDECHRTSLSNVKEDLGCFQQFLNYENTKEKFFFTATEKNVEVEDLKEDVFVSSMSNTKLYGDEIFRYPYSKAITEGYLCDYNIDIVVSRNKEKSLLKYLERKIGQKTLIYCSSCEISRNIQNLLNDNKIKEVYYLDSSSRYKQTILKKFKKKDKNSIMVLCKMCIVGYDEPQIDNVIHFDITKSPIELSQKNGRALRLFNGKQRAIFTFFVNQDNKSDEENIKKCMMEMIKNDPRLEEKIKKIRDKKNKGEIHPIEIRVEDDKNEQLEYSATYDRYLNLICYDNSKLSYVEIQEIILDYDIKTKEMYFHISDKDQRLPKNPNDYFKGKFNWVDYLSIKKENYFTLEECRKHCLRYLENFPKLKKDYLLEPSKITRSLSELNGKFPPHDLWCEIYSKNNVKDIVRKRTRKTLAEF